MTDNLGIWNVLGRTDPEHTKKFTRGGGFKGTAIKPIYTDRKMTEKFGPCGQGWGVSEPQFQMVPGSDGQVAVYCWLSIWFVDEGGKRSDPIPGVGGDFVIKKFSSGLTTDDEAFKKAFTDAIGNAMKHLGMSADVHMGLFDDSKYVADLKREGEEERRRPVAATPFDAPPEIELSSSQLMAEAMIEALGKRAGDDAVNQFLSKPAIARDLSVMEREDYDRVHDFANERRQQAAVRAA
jgi:hypothetical protein